MRQQAISAERWAAIRALRELEPPTFPRLAVAAKVHVSSLRERASIEGWRKLDLSEARARAALARRTPQDDARQMAEAKAAVEALGEGDHAGFLRRQLDDLLSGAAKGGGLPDKARIDALIAVTRLIEKVNTLAPERADQQKGDDDALRTLLKAIDERIVDLAVSHARWLVAQDDPRLAG